MSITNLSSLATTVKSFICKIINISYPNKVGYTKIVMSVLFVCSTGVLAISMKVCSTAGQFICCEFPIELESIQVVMSTNSLVIELVSLIGTDTTLQ